MEGEADLTGRVIADETKARALGDALEGKSLVGEVAARHDVSHYTIRKWLSEHYADHPDDPRRHLVVRASKHFPRDGEPAQGQLPLDAGNGEASETNGAAARDEMGKSQTPQKIDLKTRAKILKRVAKGKESKTAIAKEYGIHGSTITYWEKHPRDDEADEETAARQEPFFADVRAGMKNGELEKKHGISTSTVYAWKKKLKRLVLNEKRKAGLDKARAAMAEKRKDPDYRADLVQRRLDGKRRKRAEREAAEAALSPASQTQLSRPEPEPLSMPRPASERATLVRYQPPRPDALPPSATGGAGAFIGEAFTECVEERQTLRGMVTLLQREADAMKRKIEAYRSRYGEI